MAVKYSKGLSIIEPAPKPPERRDAARNRLRILEAARRLLEERPIQDICMDELAKTAGVGKGTLYRRFADRASLCRALLHDESTTLQNHVLSGMDLPVDASWTDRIEELLSALFDFVHDNAPLLSEALAFERGRTVRFDHPSHAWQREALVLYMSKAAEAQEISPTDPVVFAEWILAALDPDLMQWHVSQGASREALKTRFSKFWRVGLAGGN